MLFIYNSFCSFIASNQPVLMCALFDTPKLFDVINLLTQPNQAPNIILFSTYPSCLQRKQYPGQDLFN